MLFYYQINATATAHEAMLKDKPNDREVDELLELFELTQAPLLRAVEARVHWHTGQLPRWVRGLLILGALGMGLGCFLVRNVSRSCFTVRPPARSHPPGGSPPAPDALQSFQINDSIACPVAGAALDPRRLHVRACLGGSAARLLLMPGRIAIGAFCGGFLCLRVRAPLWRQPIISHARLRRCF